MKDAVVRMVFDEVPTEAGMHAESDESTARFGHADDLGEDSRQLVGVGVQVCARHGGTVAVRKGVS